MNKYLIAIFAAMIMSVSSQFNANAEEGATEAKEPTAEGHGAKHNKKHLPRKKDKKHQKDPATQGHEQATPGHEPAAAEPITTPAEHNKIEGAASSGMPAAPETATK